MKPCALVCLVILMLGCDGLETNEALNTRLDVLQTQSTLIEIDRERAILGTFKSADTIFLSGGATGRESGIIYRFDGMTLTEEDTPPGPAIWWLWGNRDGEMWACGDGGRILRRTAQGDWSSEQTPIADNTILYGIWGNDSGQLFAVGGSYRIDGEQNIILTSRGNGVWERVPNLDPPEPFTFFKVWGNDPMWVVG
ncbi:MAG: hypothetical protein ACPGQS_02240, partial [Bradymonadia bacterium]